MNYVASEAKLTEPAKDPMVPSIVKRLDSNLERMHANVNQIEDHLHRILNNRRPTPDTKSETPMENDFDSAMNNRLISFSMLNERLENIIHHLSKIVG